MNTYEQWHEQEDEAHRRRLKRWLIALLAVIVTLLIGFLIESPLAGTRWEVQQINGQAPTATDRPITAEFTHSWIGPHVIGSTGCNNYEAAFIRYGKLLKIVLRNITDMACPVPDQEDDVLAVLQAAVVYDLTSDRLVLTTLDGRELIFTRQ